MLAESIERAATLLHAARTNHRLLDDLPEDCRPTSLHEAYLIQDRVVALLGEDIDGWFLGCTNPAIRKILGLPGPYAARLLKSAVKESPAVLDVPEPLEIVLEVEFAFRLSRDLPPRDRAYTEREVADAVVSVHPAIEVVISHFEDWTHKDVYSLIADNGTDGALVYGVGTQDWRALDLPVPLLER